MRLVGEFLPMLAVLLLRACPWQIALELDLYLVFCKKQRRFFRVPGTHGRVSCCAEERMDVQRASSSRVAVPLTGSGLMLRSFAVQMLLHCHLLKARVRNVQLVQPADSRIQIQWQRRQQVMYVCCTRVVRCTVPREALPFLLSGTLGGQYSSEASSNHSV